VYFVICVQIDVVKDADEIINTIFNTHHIHMRYFNIGVLFLKFV